MTIGNTFENDLMKLIFQAVAIANIADNAASSPLTSLYLSLHTADPTDAGTQSTSEISYTGYARVAVLRSASGWTVTNNVATPVAEIAFGQMTGGAGGTATYAVVGTASSGTGKMIINGALSPSIVVASGTVPKLTTSSTITLD